MRISDLSRIVSYVRELNLKITPELLICVLPLLVIRGYTENNRITAVFLILFLIFLIFHKSLYERFDFRLQNIMIWLLLILWGTSVLMRSPVQSSGLKYFTILIIMPFLLFQIITNLNPSEHFFRKFINVQLFTGLILGLGSLSYLLLFSFQEKLRLSSFWEGHNLIAGYFMVLFMFNLSFIINRKDNRQFLFHIVTIFGIVMGLFLTQTRGVWLASVIAILLYFIKRPKIAIPFAMIVSLLSLVFASTITSRIGTIFNFTKDASAVGRLQAWATSLLLIKANPLIGYGFDSYVTLRDSVFSFYIVETIHAHHTVLNLIVEMGIIGTVLYLFFFVKAFWYSFSFRDKEFHEKYKYLIDGFQLSFIGLIIIFNFEPYFSVYDNISLVIWILISLAFLLKRMSLTERSLN